jgi:extracellular elastinolytic metalloproteinase
VAGRSFTVPGELAVEPTVPAEQALREAAAYLASDPGEEEDVDAFGQSLREPALDLTRFAPTVRTVGSDRPDLVTSFDAPPFPHAVTAALVWFPLAGGLRLGWHMRLQPPDGPVYRVIVDADDGRILLCRRLTRAIVGRAEVVLTAGEPRRAVTFPMPLDSYGAPVPANLPAGFPDPWLLDRSTRGASVLAVLADTATPVQGTADGANVRFPAPADEDSPNQLVVNLFALCSAMHDVLYLLGFREADGNFQADNFGRGGRQSDPVFARVHPGPVWGTANMGTPADGRAPTMNMGLVSQTNRHTALDPDVVYHEYTHGLTNRLVGGPMNDTALDAEQSGGMGEGWSDFIACIVLGKMVVGDWVVAQPTGIRRFRYDDQFPDTFADIGTGRYVGSKPHNLGEIWCATLMSLARQLGAWPTAQIVVDGLKLTAANPSFLAARDAILLAGDQFFAARGDSPAVRTGLVHTIWEVFARYGMGPGARTNGAMATGVVADFEVPPRPSSTSTVRASGAGMAIPDNDAVGVVSTVTLPDEGPIIDVAVTVDITHPYKGDLVVALDAPDRQRVTLHQRTGAGANDLRRTWRSQDHPGLAELRGSQVGGSWSLHVVDRAPVDVGMLNTWSIEADVGDAPTPRSRHRPSGWSSRTR